MPKNDEKLKRAVYEAKLAELHFELVKMQYWIKADRQEARRAVRGP